MPRLCSFLYSTTIERRLPEYARAKEVSDSFAAISILIPAFISAPPLNFHKILARKSLQRQRSSVTMPNAKKLEPRWPCLVAGCGVRAMSFKDLKSHRIRRHENTAVVCVESKSNHCFRFLYLL